MRLLLVDDDPDFRSLIERSAPEWLEVTSCASTRDAVDLLRSAPPHADVSLIDVQMDPFLEPLPEREGLGLVRWMATSSVPTPTILVSANSRPEESQGPGALQVMGFLSKPVDLDRLYRFFAAFQALFGTRP